MERLQIAAAIVLTFVILGGLPADSLMSRGSRWKRQVIRVISNQSLPCEQLEMTLTEQSGGTPPRRIQLNDDDKKQLMRMRGFDFMPSLMASAEKEATQVADILQPTKSRVVRGLGISTRKELVGSEKAKPLSRSEILARLRTSRNVKRAASDAAAAAATSHTNERDAAAAPAAGQQFPYVLPEDIGINRTTAQFTTTEDFITTVDYCITRTTPAATIDGLQYLRMCTACATTTTSPSDVWPSLLYGAVCNTADDNCLYEGTVSYGKCMPSEMPVTLLRKTTEACVLVLEGGENVISEDWLPFTYYIGIGCECAVAEQSRFR